MSATPTPGTVLGGKFRVIRQLGEGGMGLVLEAENTVSGKRVAVKWMRPELAARQEAVERFVREARASARVRHPNVVDVYDVVHDGPAVFLVMELLEGEPLTAVLERGGMPAYELVALLLDAMRGVAAAHREGVIHRDIKPDNIFLARETDRSAFTPKVLDFGISKLNDGQGLSLTQTGAALGTPLYMSYEQLCGVRDIDARTDVYAFGVILYEALTGRPPYDAETFPELVVKIANTHPTPPKSLRSDIPRTLDRLIQAAMAKDRDQRLPSLEAFIKGLEPFATRDLFRAQMTADDAALPRVVSPSQQPAPEPAELLSERTEIGTVDTPLNASVPVPIPGRRSGTPWLIGGGVGALLLAAAMVWGSSSSEQTPQVKPPAADSPNVPAAATNSLAAEPNIERGMAPPDPVGPDAGVAEAKHAAAAHEASDAPKLKQSAETLAHPKAAVPPVRHGAKGVAPIVQPPAAVPIKPAPAAKSDTEEKPSLRAGRPRSQDF